MAASRATGAPARVSRVRRSFAMHAYRLLRRGLPQTCALCAARAGDALVCDACAATLPRLPPGCPVCALPASGTAVCGACLGRPPHFAATVAALVYAFPVDRLLQQLKYAGRLAFAEWAAAALAERVAASLRERRGDERPDRVIALPLSSLRQRERGFNQAHEIARRVARTVDLPIAGGLERTAGGVPQAALPWAERARNVRGAFAVSPPGAARDAHIALVDDVMTTGATLSEAARTLRRAGAARVECWVVARTLPPVDR